MQRKPTIGIILLTVFIDLVGFGIVVPLVPMFSHDFHAPGWAIGLIAASFSAMQFVFSPIWGRLSDRIGRRPVLLISTAGAAVAYALFAYGAGQPIASGAAPATGALILLAASRAFAGICGGNITVAQAYIADITPPENRSRRMGLIGMAFGLGFIFGPIISGISLAVTKHNSSPGWVACFLCAANFLLALAILPESRQRDSVAAPPRPHLDQFLHTLRRPKIGTLVGVFFLATFCFSAFESTLPLLVIHNFGLIPGPDSHSNPTVIYLFAYCGVLGALVQGGAIGRLVKKHGEPRIIAVSLLLTGLSLAPMPFISGQGTLSWATLWGPGGFPWLLLLAVLGVLSIGSALTRPPLFGMLSNLTSASDQGGTLGVAQSAGSLARIVGPIYANTLFDAHPAWTYVSCAVVALLAGGLASARLGGHTSPESAGAAS